MTDLLTAAQMREIEAAAIESGAVTGLELMERAGRGAVDAILAEWPELRGGARRAVVLCGPGNNGGDGFVVARLLAERGWDVEAFLHGDADRLPPDARVAHDRWATAGDVPGLTSETFSARPVPGRCDLVIDALFGIGLSRPVDLPLHALRRGAGQSHRIVALDMPSGICGDSGRALRDGEAGESVAADLTLAFHARKLGQHLAAGPGACGKVAVVEIGLPAPRLPAAPVSPGAELQAVPPGGTDHAGSGRVRLVSGGGGLGKRGGHKFDHGHALVLSGGVGRGGAARLAARGALRIGAGLVTVGCPPAALIENAARLDAIMLRSVRDAGALREVLEDARIVALCLGPGLGTGAREAALVRTALETGRETGLATVLDGDALTMLAGDAELMAALHGRCVLTPHAGEFARMFPDIAGRLAADPSAGPAYSKVDAAREADAGAGCAVAFKGPDTVIASPDGRAGVSVAAYDRAAPWLATAGSGDVLAGFATGLLARGLDPHAAAEAAAWLHVECALRFGPGLIAEDLPEALPGALADLAP